jgi:RND family efflux transporter MFP subunit
LDSSTKNISAAARCAWILPLAALVAACGASHDAARNAPAQAPLVEAVMARAGALPVEETVPGMVRARNQVAIHPEIAARVVAVLARSGDRVERGQALVRLDEAEARERLRQAEADVQVEQAAAAASEARTTELEARVARSRALAAEELVSAQELETLEAQLDALRAGAAEAAARVAQVQATVEERRSALGKTVVRAPVSGRLGERRVEVGMLVDPGTLLFVVGDLDRLILEVTLPEEMLAQVRAGQPVLIETREEGAPIAAELSRISPFLDPDSFTARGEIDVDNRELLLRPGMFVTVRILVGESRHATLVPVSAVWEDPASGIRGVFVIEQPAGLAEPEGEVDGAAIADAETPRAVSFRPVTVIAEGHGQAGVTGVDEGAWVVTVGQQLLGGEPGEVTAVEARVRPVTWSRVLKLQGLQDEDLLAEFLAKQRTLAAVLGAEIPPSEDVVKAVLDEAAAAQAPAQPPTGS